jgi:hypothetical protein
MAGGRVGAATWDGLLSDGMVEPSCKPGAEALRQSLDDFVMRI